MSLLIPGSDQSSVIQAILIDTQKLTTGELVTGELITNDLITNEINVGTTTITSGKITGIFPPFNIFDVVNKDYVDTIVSTSSATPGGSNSNVQFNADGLLSGSNNFTWTTSTNTLSITNGLIVTTRVTGLVNPTQGSDAANKSYVDLISGSSPQGVDKSIQFNGNGLFSGSNNLTWTTSTNTLSITGSLSVTTLITTDRVTGLSSPILNSDAVNKSYVDTVTSQAITGTSNNFAYFTTTGYLSSNSTFTRNDYTGIDQIINQDLTNDIYTKINNYDVTLTPGTNFTNGINQEYKQLILNSNGSNIFQDVTQFNSNFDINSVTSTTITINNFSSNTDSDTIISNFNSDSFNNDFSGKIDNVNGYNMNSVFRTSFQSTANITNYNANNQFETNVNSLTVFNVSGSSIGPGTGSPNSFIGINLGTNFENIVENYTGYNLSTGNNSNVYNFTGVNINPSTITNSFTGVNVSGNTNNCDFFNGINVNINNSNTLSANGLNIDMSNCTPLPGQYDSIVIQDLTYTAQNIGVTGISITYVTNATPSVDVVSPNITVNIVDGVTNANDIKTLIDNDSEAIFLVSAVVSGVGTNIQTSQSITFLTGGVNPGTIRSANLVGDVNIQGSLTFSGALSIGQLSSFYQQTLVSSASPGVPTSLDSLITGIVAPTTSTINNADTLGINTACLMQFQEGATVSTTFLGLSALGLPAVVGMQTGSSVDRVVGASFALSLDSSSTGGVIENVSLCRALAIPNSATTVTQMKAYDFSLPFGSISTNTYGLFIEPECYNFINGSLKISSTTTNDTKITNNSVGLEISNKHLSFKSSLPTTSGTTGNNLINILPNSTDSGGILEYYNFDSFTTGIQATITFTIPFETIPILTISPRNEFSTNNTYITTSTTDFNIGLSTASISPTTYSWFYSCFQSNN